MAQITKPSRETAKAAPGRPSMFSDALAEEICERLACGESLRRICADDAMPSKATVMRWLAKDAAFRTMYSRARELQMQVWIDDMIDLARSEPERDPVTGRYDLGSVLHIRNQVCTFQWLMKKLMPKKFGTPT